MPKPGCTHMVGEGWLRRPCNKPMPCPDHSRPREPIGPIGLAFLELNTRPVATPTPLLGVPLPDAPPQLWGDWEWDG